MVELANTGKVDYSKLFSFVRYYANCPCCDQYEDCEEGCSFRQDDPCAWDVMQEARDAMFAVRGVV